MKTFIILRHPFRLFVFAFVLLLLPGIAGAAGFDTLPVLAANNSLKDLKTLGAVALAVVAIVIGLKNYPLIAEGFSDIGNQREGGLQKVIGGILAPGAFIVIAIAMTLAGLGDAAVGLDDVAAQLRK